ncbi:unnamed protein product [Moneuplotes crassus]|uniref:Uncharacterized protein n=1 Tax=Euplotes crassus TaxID=5936 RepID=A0AAD1XXC0_EUPCR|nr:unnamed protein product [Moneuplotes crassus]
MLSQRLKLLFPLQSSLCSLKFSLSKTPLRSFSTKPKSWISSPKLRLHYLFYSLALGIGVLKYLKAGFNLIEYKKIEAEASPELQKIMRKVVLEEGGLGSERLGVEEFKILERGSKCILDNYKNDLYPTVTTLPILATIGLVYQVWFFNRRGGFNNLQIFTTGLCFLAVAAIDLFSINASKGCKKVIDSSIEIHDQIIKAKKLVEEDINEPNQTKNN